MIYVITGSSAALVQSELWRPGSATTCARVHRPILGPDLLGPYIKVIDVIALLDSTTQYLGRTVTVELFKMFPELFLCVRGYRLKVSQRKLMTHPIFPLRRKMVQVRLLLPMNHELIHKRL